MKDARKTALLMIKRLIMNRLCSTITSKYELKVDYK